MEQYILYEGIFEKHRIKLSELFEFMEVDERKKFEEFTTEIINANVIYVSSNLTNFQTDEEKKNLEKIGHINLGIEFGKIKQNISLCFNKRNLELSTEVTEMRYNEDKEFRDKKLGEFGMTEEEKIKNIFLTCDEEGMTDYDWDKRDVYIEQLEDEKEKIYHDKDRRAAIEKAYVKASEFYTNKLLPGKEHKKVLFMD